MAGSERLENRLDGSTEDEARAYRLGIKALIDFGD